MIWTPDSWTGRPIHQQPDYRDQQAVDRALATVKALPPLVAPGEVDALKAHLARAARGEAFVLQGGDCAERFVDCAKQPIENKLKILLQMSLVLTWGARIPVVRIGRMAGQYAKPRSRPTEVIDGVEMASYRGDHVNGHLPDVAIREPDPERLVQAYFHSAAVMNYARALLDGGFADLHHPQDWDLGFMNDPARRAEHEDMLARIVDALDFVEAAGVTSSHVLRTVDLYSSHEGLLLPWEAVQTEPVGEEHYNLGTHFLWIGDRTRQLDGAHVEYFRGIRNPIGVKVGPTMKPEELVALLDTLDPDDEPGRMTLITRFGADKIRSMLPPLIQAVQATGRTVLWSADPMHGNTRSTQSGLKTRDADDIYSEVDQAMAIHEELGSHLGGVHFELTGDNVTECTGGPEGLSDNDLSHAYETYCDPRLNYTQSLEMAFRLAHRLAERRTP